MYARPSTPTRGALAGAVAMCWCACAPLAEPAGASSVAFELDVYGDEPRVPLVADGVERRLFTVRVRGGQEPILDDEVTVLASAGTLVAPALGRLENERRTLRVAPDDDGLVSFAYRCPELAPGRELLMALAGSRAGLVNVDCIPPPTRIVPNGDCVTTGRYPATGLDRCLLGFAAEYRIDDRWIAASVDTHVTATTVDESGEAVPVRALLSPVTGNAETELWIMSTDRVYVTAGLLGPISFAVSGHMELLTQSLAADVEFVPPSAGGT